MDPQVLIRRVVRSQRLAEEKFSSYTFDQLETETLYGKEGNVEEVRTRLFYALSGENGEEGSRELIQVNGRSATAGEKKKAAESDASGRKKRLERRAAMKASRSPSVSGTDDDPMVGTRRLSELLAKYQYQLEADETIDGRLTHVLEFSPRKGLKPSSLGDRALSALAGRVLIDATDEQIRLVDAHLVEPVKVVGGLAAKVNEATIHYEASPVKDRWFPHDIRMRLKGKKALFFRLDTGYRFELTNYKSFKVDTESAVVPKAGP